jgi:hypothetical protein
MKYQNILNAIVNDVQSKMLRLGVNCQFTLGVAKDYRNEEYIKITGSNFFMQPMIFKNIHIEGIVKSVVNEKEDSVDFIVSLEYRYTTWDNGGNGTDIGKIIYRVENKWAEKDNARFMEKIKGLEI